MSSFLVVIERYIYAVYAGSDCCRDDVLVGHLYAVSGCKADWIAADNSAQFLNARHFCRMGSWEDTFA